MDLEELHAFLAVAGHGSFLAASRTSGMSRSTLRRRVAALESRAGVRLVRHTGRGVVLTGAGEALAKGGHQMLHETNKLLDSIRDAGDEPRGIVRAIIPPGMPPLALASWCRDVRRELPGVTLELRVVGNPLVALAEGADLALHFEPPPGGPWISRELRRLRERLMVSGKYLARRGAPSTVRDLSGHDLIAACGAGEDPHRWPLLSGGEISISPAVVATEIHVVFLCVKLGLGIGLLPDVPFALGGPALAGNEVVPVLTEAIGCERILHVTVHQRLADVPKVAGVVREAQRGVERARTVESSLPPPGAATASRAAR